MKGDSVPLASSAEAVFRRGHARFSAVLSIAEANLEEGNVPAAVALAKLAAGYAFPAGTGLFGSPRLERLLISLGQHVTSSSGVTSAPRADGRRHVLHVLTYAKPIGGDTRFVWRWMQLDKSSRHSVAITAQAEVSNTYDVPPELTSASLDSGGSVHVLQAPHSRPLEQAGELRELCRPADVVVLHLYPHDVVPVLALATDCYAKVLLVNHSDHTFWIGSGVADCVANLREQSSHFLSKRRGLNPHRMAMLPIPISEPADTIERKEAKKALGYSADTVLLLTIASPFKYSAPGQTGLLDLVTPVILKHSNTVLAAVGPIPDGAWAAAAAACSGRVQAKGRRWDNDLLYAAADIYLDSVPFSSITSLLEAGRRGAPLLGFRSANRDLNLLGPGAPGLDGAMRVETDVHSYRSHLSRLIDVPPLRVREGAHIQARIHSLHAGDGWLEALDKSYACLDASVKRGCLGADGDVFEASELDAALMRLFAKVQGRSRTRQLARHCIAPLAYRSRLAATASLYRHGFDLSVSNLLPPPFDTVIHGLGRRIKRSFAGA